VDGFTTTVRITDHRMYDPREDGRLLFVRIHSIILLDVDVYVIDVNAGMIMLVPRGRGRRRLCDYWHRRHYHDYYRPTTLFSYCYEYW
jgi:hypothetical protein